MTPTTLRGRWCTVIFLVFMAIEDAGRDSGARNSAALGA
ncbi:Uncharacterised protein [Mycobacteroides abscessus subsp. abscessus]|nr:Uncharacterised protein [Mycobacteroides abscessus subsp. abscessus]SKT14311.1 Uncharacterised protein [Mycobacteroides abscessus subsp. abscessus]